jgi:hypothetical protein
MIATAYIIVQSFRLSDEDAQIVKKPHVVDPSKVRDD